MLINDKECEGSLDDYADCTFQGGKIFSSSYRFVAIDAAITIVNLTSFTRYELGSEVIDSL